MVWYESQLAGTIIGAALGFLFAYVPSALERRRARKCLLHLLRAEIAVATEQLREKIADARRILESVSRGGGCKIFTSERRLDEIFAANLINMVTIKPYQAEEIFRFYQSVARYRGLSKVLSQDSIKQGDDNSEFCEALSRLIEFMDDGISRGDRIVSELSVS